MMEDATKRMGRFDTFADQFRLNFNPNGALMLFQRTNAFDPPIVGPDGQPQMAYEEVGQVRVTPAHLKQMVFLAWKTIVQQAKDVPGGSVPLPLPVLQGMNINLDEWAAFWGETSLKEVQNAPPIPQPVPVVGPVPTPPAISGIPAGFPTPSV